MENAKKKCLLARLAANRLPNGSFMTIRWARPRRACVREGGRRDADRILREVPHAFGVTSPICTQLSHEEAWSLEDGIVKDGRASTSRESAVRDLAERGKPGFAYSD